MKKAFSIRALFSLGIVLLFIFSFNTVSLKTTHAQIPTITIPAVPTIVMPTLPTNLTITPIPLPTTPSTQTTTNNENSTTTTSTNTSTNTSTSSNPSGTNNSNTPGNTQFDIRKRKGLLVLDRTKTADGKVILTRDINEVIFLADSLQANSQPLILMMPSETDSAILFNFGAFLSHDSDGSHVKLPQAIKMEQIVDDNNISVMLPADESITSSINECGDETWNGSMTALTLLSNSAIDLPGKYVTTPIQIGRSDCKLSLSEPARITLTNKQNWHMGYRLHNQEKFTEITALCPMKTENECYMYEGKNLVVKTNHFTQFIPFKQFTFFDYLIAPFKNNNLFALGAAMLATFLLAITLSHFSILRKLGIIQKNDQEKSEYVSIASHELRTPMTTIKGWLSMILRGDFGPIKKSLKTPLEKVNDSTQHSLNLVNDILDVSRLESGKATLSLSSFSIETVIDEIIETLQPIAKEKGLTLKTKVITSTVVHADKEKVRQIITNLVGNALKCTDSGSISVSSEKTKNIVTIFVTDTGAGIPKDEQPKLFHKFQKLSTAAKKVPSSGLGLYIARQLARKMGGDVTLIKSSSGSGSTFALLLPQADRKEVKKIAE